MDRTKLPYRDTSDVFLIYKGKLICRDDGHYIMYPGGGIDSGESVIKAAKRECKEEIGVDVKDLKLIESIEWDWPVTWANTPKRKLRYQQFRGERSHLLIGKVLKLGKPTSTDGDAWNTKTMTMPLTKAIALHNKYMGITHPNAYAYKKAQGVILNMLKQVSHK